MKNIFTLTTLFLLSLALSPKHASADHVMGSEITYKCTATPGVFEITFVIYRDCSGIPVCPQSCGSACTRSIQIMGADASCSSTSFGSVNLSLQNVRDVNINAQCPSAKNTCNNMGCVVPGTYTPALERYEFKGLANLGPTSGIPASCCNIRFVFSECCRSSTINTGSSWQNFYVDAIINRCLSTSPCNSSPVFTSDPGAVICSGENFIYNMGAADPDFDSLSYAFAPALQGFNSSVTYDPPFSYDKPMPWSGAWNGTFPDGISCDPSSGDIRFTPHNPNASNFYGVVAIEVKQWKTIGGIPTVIGKTSRDMQMVVLANCPPNNSPRFKTDPPSTANPLLPKTNWEVCGGHQLCFDIIAKDTDVALPAVSDTTFLEWNGALASLGATFTPNYVDSNRRKPSPLGGPREDSYRFCWTPAANLASTTPYYFTVSAKDSRCPNPGKISQAFSVKVTGSCNLSIESNKLVYNKQLGVKVFPNPVKNLLSITVKILPEDKTITLYDLQGKMVLQQTLTESQQLNLEALTQGVYILKIGDWRGQIIKQ